MDLGIGDGRRLGQPIGWGILWFVVFGLFEFGKCEIEVAICGYINVSFGVVLGKVEAAINISVPVNGYFMVVFYSTDEVIGIGSDEIFYATIVNAEGGNCFAAGVLPQSWLVLRLFMNVGDKFGHKLCKCNVASFLESIYATVHFKIDMYISV